MRFIDHGLKLVVHLETDGLKKEGAGHNHKPNRRKQRTRKQGKEDNRSQITKDPSRSKREGGKRKSKVIKGKIGMPM